MKVDLLGYAKRWLSQTANLEHYTTYSEEELLPVADLMVEYMVTTPIPHESLFKKYAHKRYFRVCPTLFLTE